MRSSTKNHLIAIVVTAIIILIAVWYITYPRQSYNKVYTLYEIIYNPPPNAGPALTFNFSSSIDPSLVYGNAVVKDFTISPNTRLEDMNDATIVINALLDNGGVPFIPTETTQTSITSNAIPSKLLNLTNSITINGSGVMWFSIPKT